MPRPKTWNPGRPTIKALQSRIAKLENLRQGDISHFQKQREEIDRLTNGIQGAQTEIERQRKDNQWLKQLVQNLSEAIFNRSRH